MSMTQNFDYDQSNKNQNMATGAANTASGTNADYDLKDAQLDEASASSDQSGFGSSLGGIGNLTQQASHVVCRKKFYIFA